MVIEDLGKALKTEMGKIFTDLMDADHGVDTKLDRSPQLLEPKK